MSPQVLTGSTGGLENDEHRHQQRIAGRRSWPVEQKKLQTVKQGRMRRAGDIFDSLSGSLAKILGQALFHVAYIIRRYRLVDDSSSRNKPPVHCATWRRCGRSDGAQVVGGGSRYFLVKRMYRAINQLRDGS